MQNEKHMNNNSKIDIVLLILILGLSIFVSFSEKRNTNILMNILEKQADNYHPRNKQIISESDLVSFSILPNSAVHGVISYRGIIKNNYFFEGNIRINILNMNKQILKESHATATTDWMTSGPVSFEGVIDLSMLPKGPAYMEIHNDNPSGLPENDKSILIPIVIN